MPLLILFFGYIVAVTLGRFSGFFVSALVALALVSASLLPRAMQSNSHESLLQKLVDLKIDDHASKTDRDHSHSHDLSDQIYPGQLADHSHDHNPGDHSHDLPLVFENQKAPPGWLASGLKAFAMDVVIKPPLYRIKRPPRI